MPFALPLRTQANACRYYAQNALTVFDSWSGRGRGWVMQLLAGVSMTRLVHVGASTCVAVGTTPLAAMMFLYVPVALTAAALCVWEACARCRRPWKRPWNWSDLACYALFACVRGRRVCPCEPACAPCG